jgi:hypothetical protein
MIGTEEELAIILELETGTLELLTTTLDEDATIEEELTISLELEGTTTITLDELS